MFEADSICDRIAVIKKGAIIAEGTPSSIKRVVENQGVVEFEVVGMPADRLAGLRGLAGVSSVTVVDQELAQVVTINCTCPADVMTQLGVILEGLTLRKVSSREPTLEDAYVQLIGESS
jgi:ABC-2 type transport system ATP-binding protein